MNTTSSSAPPTKLDAHAEDFPLRRLDELYKLHAVDHADHMVDEILELFPGTEISAEALYTRSRHRRAREDQEGALQDLLDAAGQGRGEWSLRSAWRAGVHCQMMEWQDRAQAVFEFLVIKWPRTVTAARAAGELAYIHRGSEKAESWEKIQIDILHLLVCDPTPETDDDLAALEQAVEVFLDRPDGESEPKDTARATSCAQELLRRASLRGQVEYAKAAKLALVAIETGRLLNVVWTLAALGDDPRLSGGALN